MPTSTYTPLANITLGTSAASVTFSSISGSYRHLVLVVNGKCLTGNTDMYIRFNSDTGTNYPGVRMAGNGSSTSSDTANTTAMRAGFISNSDTTQILNVMDYSATDKHKTVLIRSNQISSSLSAEAGRWANNAAITSLTVLTGGYNFDTGTTMSLYGIAS